MTQQTKPTARLAVGIPCAWLLVFFVLPLLIVLRISLSHAAPNEPPYAPLFNLFAGWPGVTAFFNALSFDNYIRIGADPFYLLVFVKSIGIAAFATLFLLLLGYPLAYGIARTPRRVQTVLMTLVVLPFWTGLLIRGYAWMDVLQHAAPAWLGTDAAVFIGIVYAYLPLMVLPLHGALSRLDETLLDTAADLGCPRWKIFWELTLPLSAPGVLTGALLCFVATLGAFVIPDLLGSAQAPMIGPLIWAEFFGANDWPAAAAVAVVLFGLVLVPIVVVQYQAMRAAERG
jgi:putrescine transport system permease protein